MYFFIIIMKKITSQPYYNHQIHNIPITSDLHIIFLYSTVTYIFSLFLLDQVLLFFNIFAEYSLCCLLPIIFTHTDYNSRPKCLLKNEHFNLSSYGEIKIRRGLSIPPKLSTTILNIFQGYNPFTSHAFQAGNY